MISRRMQNLSLPEDDRTEIEGEFVPAAVISSSEMLVVPIAAHHQSTILVIIKDEFNINLMITI